MTANLECATRSVRLIDVLTSACDDRLFEQQPTDQRALFHALGGCQTSPLEVGPPRRVVRISGTVSQRIEGPPLPVAGVIDGIQPAPLVVARRSHRPVVMAYVAAGCLRPSPRPTIEPHRELLALIVSHLDAAWAAGLPGHMPVVEVEDSTPFGTAQGIADGVDSLRRLVERQVVVASTAEDGVLLVDGSLRGFELAPAPLVGVVKTVRGQYLTDERCLTDLPEGWISPTFVLSASRRGERDIFSTYCRLWSADGRVWNHGLIRLEAYDDALLPPAAMRCMMERQGPMSGDGRWDRHLKCVAVCETLLRSRIPATLNGGPRSV